MKQTLGKEGEKSSNLFIIHSPCHNYGHCTLASNYSINCKYTKQLDCDLNNANKQNRPNRSIWQTDYQPTFRINRINEEKVIKTAYLNKKEQHLIALNRLAKIEINYYFLKFFSLINLISLTTTSPTSSIKRGFKFLVNELIRRRLLFLIQNLNFNLKFSFIIKQTRIWIQFLLIFDCLFTCDAIKNQYNKAVGAVHGELVLGALFPVHHAPGPAQAQTRTCGAIREQYGIQRVEAAFQAIDIINKDKSILGNITLGIEIRDSCW